MKVLTANRLIDGEAVWYAENGWSETLSGARVAEDAASEGELTEIGKRAFAANEVVDVDLIDVARVADGLRPLRLREQIRASGPTTHPEFGKQGRRPVLQD